MKSCLMGLLFKALGLKAGILLGGYFHVTCRDRFGNIKWVETVRNLMVNEGLDAILNIMFHAATQITTWYVGIFETDTTPLATHTYAAPGYTECTAYDEATRPEYVEAAASGQQITNSANKAIFTMNATKTIYGASLVGGGSAPSTKGDTAGGGTLACACKFTTSKPVEDDDKLEVTYILSAADDGT